MPLALARAFTGSGPRPSDRLWGALPIEEIEGHQVEGAYDVRPIEGLGRPPIRSERLAGLGIWTDEDRYLQSRQDNLELRALARPSAIVQAATGGGTAAAPPQETARSSSSSAVLGASLGSNLGSMLPLAVLAGALLLLGGKR